MRRRRIATTPQHRKKTPFSGAESEKAYLLGLASREYAAVRHGNVIRVRTKTTHPLSSRHFLTTFGRFGRVRLRPKFTKSVGAHWDLGVDLDESFHFLLEKNEPMKGRWDQQSFLNFLAGIVDAEGSIYLHRPTHAFSFEIQLRDANKVLLQEISSKLGDMNLFSKLSLVSQRPSAVSPAQDI